MHLRRRDTELKRREDSEMATKKTTRGFAARVVVPLLLALAMATLSSCEVVNNTPGGLVWSSAEEAQDLVRTAEPAVALDDRNGMDGGFSSLDGMLQWAIGHSDPDKLKDSAQDVQRLPADELQRRQTELKELVEKLKMPSDSQLMKIALDDLNNASLALEDRHRALHELLELVEPIDNANDLGKLGGLKVVIGELDHADEDVRKLSAWVLGKASQNNPFVQKQVLELGALTSLIKMVSSSFTEEAVKALYAVSALIRNNPAGQEMFFAGAGHVTLQGIMSNSNIDIRLQKKAVFLVGDLADSQLEDNEKAEPPVFSDPLFLKSVVDLITSLDLDLQEKALVATKNLLQLGTTKPQVFRDFCGLDVVLERMKQQLKELTVDEDLQDYVRDIESLRAEVETVFQRKLATA